jgi:hypothetical protein
MDAGIYDIMISNRFIYRTGLHNTQNTGAQSGTPDHLFLDSALILDHSYLVGKFTSLKFADTKVSGF